MFKVRVFLWIDPGTINVHMSRFTRTHKALLKSFLSFASFWWFLINVFFIRFWFKHVLGELGFEARQLIRVRRSLFADLRLRSRQASHTSQDGRFRTSPSTPNDRWSMANKNGAPQPGVPEQAAWGDQLGGIVSESFVTKQEIIWDRHWAEQHWTCIVCML